MSRPTKIWISPLVALIFAGLPIALAQNAGNPVQPAQRQRPQAVAAPQPPSITMQQLVMDWERQSEKLKTLELAIYRVDKDAQWGDEEHYLGHAAFKNPQLVFLDFRKVTMQEQPDPKDKKKKQLVPLQKNNQFVSVPFERIVCTGVEVWQYRYDVKQIFIFPLDKDQRKRALEEGPLPFLFNMRAVDAQKRYEMTLKGEDKKSYLVMIKPRLQQDQDTFRTAWVWLDKEFLLPNRILLLDPNGKMTKEFELSQIKANQKVDPRLFVGVNPDNQFKIERNPGGPVPANIARTLRRQQDDAKAAQRPQDPHLGQPR
jgi:TIGR03009 family protein